LVTISRPSPVRCKPVVGYALDESTPEVWKSITLKEIPVGDLWGMIADEALGMIKGRAGAAWRSEVLVKTRNGGERWLSDTAVQEEAQRIIAAARRARDLVHRLHLFTRGTDEDKPQAVQVNEAAVQAVQVTRPRWKDAAEARGLRCEVATDVGDVPSIKGAESRLRDIFVNLLLNAVDAMPKGGGDARVESKPGKGTTFTIRLSGWEADRARHAGGSGGA